MATDATIEGRLEAVEEAIEELRRKVDDRATVPNWLDHFIGAFKDERHSRRSCSWAGNSGWRTGPSRNPRREESVGWAE